MRGRVEKLRTELDRILAFRETLEADGSDDMCCLWPYCKKDNRYGYGELRINHRIVYVHRLVYEMKKGQIPPGMFVRHSCDTPACFNPNHLLLGTPADNSRDMVNRGRACTGERSVQSKLTKEQVAEIRDSRLNQYELAAQYGIHQSNVSRIRRGLAWK